MLTSDTLQITIERRSGDGWPIIAEYRPAGFQLASRKEGELCLGEGWQAALRERDLDRAAYGQFLGEALFRNSLRDAFMYARGHSEGQLRLPNCRRRRPEERSLEMASYQVRSIHELILAQVGTELASQERQAMLRSYQPESQ